MKNQRCVDYSRHNDLNTPELSRIDETGKYAVSEISCTPQNANEECYSDDGRIMAYLEKDE